MSNGQRVGGAQDIIATAEYGRSGYETICKFASTVASDTYISLEEAVHLIKVRHPIWKAGQEVRVSYGDKYSRQSGGSAGAAFSLLLLSLLEGIQFDPAFGITGDVTVDGKIRKVGAVAEKVRGAALERCRIVALPAVNKENLADLIVLYGPSMLWTVQLFTIENLDQAVAVARQDRAENLAKAITQFTEVQKALGQQVSVAALNNPAIVQALQEVLKLAPNHASAEYMLYGASGRLPRVLSLRGSLEEIWSAVGPMAMMLYAGAVQVDGKDANEMIMSGFSTEMFKTVNDRLNWLTNRLDPRTQGLLAAMKEFVTSVSALKSATGSGTYSSQQFQSKKDKVLGESAKLDADRRVVEELMR